MLEDIRLFDVYKGSQIPLGNLSLAFALIFRHIQRTLKDEEVNTIQENMEKTLYEKYGAVLRKI